MRPVIANLKTRRVVSAPAVIADRAEFRFGMNPGTTPAPAMRPERCLPIGRLAPASKRSALSLP